MPPTQVACQKCHMPITYRGADLAFKIANIEDNTFPRVPDTGPSTRLPDSDLTLAQRQPYGRHQLNGINLFVLEMFDQFRTDLGLFKVDPESAVIYKRPDIGAEDRGGGRRASSANGHCHGGSHVSIDWSHHAQCERNG